MCSLCADRPLKVFGCSRYGQTGDSFIISVLSARRKFGGRSPGDNILLYSLLEAVVSTWMCVSWLPTTENTYRQHATTINWSIRQVCSWINIFWWYGQNIGWAGTSDQWPRDIESRSNDGSAIDIEAIAATRNQYQLECCYRSMHSYRVVSVHKMADQFHCRLYISRLEEQRK